MPSVRATHVCSLCLCYWCRRDLGTGRGQDTGDLWVSAAMLASTLRPPSCQHGGRSHAAEVLACLPTGLPLGLDELGRSRDRTGRGGSRIVVSAHQRPHTPPMEALPQDPAQSAWPPPDFRLTHALPAEPEGEGISAGGPSAGTTAVWWQPVNRNLPTQGWRKRGQSFPWFWTSPPLLT